jgi:hypothetical protein
MEPGVAIVADTTPSDMHGSTLLTARYTPPADAIRTQPAQTGGAVLYRWDFGDGTPFVAYSNDFVGHSYLCAADNLHTVRVQITDDRGAVALGSVVVDASQTCTTEPVTIKYYFFPDISKR